MKNKKKRWLSVLIVTVLAMIQIVVASASEKSIVTEEDSSLALNEESVPVFETEEDSKVAVEEIGSTETESSLITDNNTSVVVDSEPVTPEEDATVSDATPYMGSYDYIPEDYILSQIEDPNIKVILITLEARTSENQYILSSEIQQALIESGKSLDLSFQGNETTPSYTWRFDGTTLWQPQDINLGVEVGYSDFSPAVPDEFKIDQDASYIFVHFLHQGSFGRGINFIIDTQTNYDINYGYMYRYDEQEDSYQYRGLSYVMTIHYGTSSFEMSLLGESGYYYVSVEEFSEEMAPPEDDLSGYVFSTIPEDIIRDEIQNGFKESITVYLESCKSEEQYIVSAELLNELKNTGKSLNFCVYPEYQNPDSPMYYWHFSGREIVNAVDVTLHINYYASVTNNIPEGFEVEQSAPYMLIDFSHQGPFPEGTNFSIYADLSYIGTGYAYQYNDATDEFTYLGESDIRRVSDTKSMVSLGDLAEGMYCYVSMARLPMDTNQDFPETVFDHIPNELIHEELQNGSEEEVTVNLQYSDTIDHYIVSAEIIRDLKDSGKSIVFCVHAENDNAIVYQWRIDGKRVQNVMDVNLHIDCYTSQAGNVPEQFMLNVTHPYMVLDFAHSGSLPEGTVVSILADIVYNNTSYVYHYNQETEDFTWVGFGSSAQVDASHCILTLPALSHCSYYYLSMEELGQEDTNNSSESSAGSSENSQESSFLTESESSSSEISANTSISENSTVNDNSSVSENLQNSNDVETGDQAQIVLWTILCVLSLCGGSLLLWRRHGLK